jgi:hypothetical protein
MPCVTSCRLAERVCTAMATYIHGGMPRPLLVLPTLPSYWSTRLLAFSAGARAGVQDSGAVPACSTLYCYSILSELKDWPAETAQGPGNLLPNGGATVMEGYPSCVCSDGSEQQILKKARQHGAVALQDAWFSTEGTRIDVASCMATNIPATCLSQPRRR